MALWTDTETDPLPLSDVETKHRLRFGWACFRRTRKAGDWCKAEWWRYTSAQAFWTRVEAYTRPKTRLYLFAHNWSFDAPVLGAFDILPARGWKLSKVVIESPPVILVFRKGDRSLVLLDTLNWWRMPLRKLGESVGLDKLDMPARDATRAEWDRYAKRDVEVIHRAMMAWWEFLDRYDLGTFGPTLASQAMRAFRHRFMEHPVLIDDNEHALELARDALHGGRTECFRIGKIQGPIHVLDINSMYPAVMRDEEFPSVLRLHARNVSLAELREWLSRYCVVARVRLETDRPRYQLVHEGRLVSPTGRLRLALTTPDLITALDRGELSSIEQAACYDRAPLFRPFVDSIYKLRREAIDRKDPVNGWLLKILMNSLYGKFAQRGERWEPVGVADDNNVAVWRDYDYETGSIRAFRKFSGVLQERFREGESHDSHPAIAAHVTAIARARLWNLIQTAGVGNVLYCDTDSLFLTEQGFSNLRDHCDPARLGALKHEATLAWIVIHGPKDYVTPEKQVLKGIRASAVWTDDVTVQQEKWSSLNGLVRIGDLSGPRTTVVHKRLRRVYTKGTVTKDGTVLPFVLRQW
jgi:hypothetical protein